MIGSASLSSLRSNEEITTIAKKRVIAYFMHENEKEAAVRELASAEVTDSFVVGDIEEEEIASLPRAHCPRTENKTVDCRASA